MQKKFYLLITLCALLSSLVASAQERVWKITDGKISTEKKDGSDLRIIELDPAKFGRSMQGMIKLSNGSLIFLSEEGGEMEFGVMSAITPEGIVPLYPIGDYNPRYSQNMVEGADGKLYALQNGVTTGKYGRVVSFKIDGTEFRKGGGILGNLITDDQLLVTSEGIFGASIGAGSEKGFIFKIDEAALSVQKVFSFTADSEGIRPFGKLLEGRDGMFYGTTRIGGTSNQGVVFKINKDGTHYTKMFDFSLQTGINPVGALVQDQNGTLYGTTTKGGRKGKGTLFSITESGQFNKIFDFYDKDLPTVWDDLFAGDDGFIYGKGSQFKVKPDGSEFSRTTNLFPGITLPEYLIVETISSPANLSDSVPVNLVVHVAPMKGALTYNLQISTSSDFSVMPTTFTNNEPRFNVKNLTYSTTYYVRASTSAWPIFGTVSSFTTAGPHDFPDVYLLNPGNQKSDKPIWTTYQVTPVTGATQYVLELSESSDFTDAVIHMESNTTTFPGRELKYGTLYFARVKANTNTSFGPATSFTTRGVLGYTFLSGPKGDVTDVSADSLNLTANFIVGASQYQIELTSFRAEDGIPDDFSTIRYFTSDRPAQRTFFVDHLDYGRKYSARVKTDASSEYGSTRSFTTRVKEFKTRLPGDGQTDVPVINVRVEMDVIRAADRYNFFLSESPTDYNAPFTLSQSTTTNYAFFSGLKHDTRYYVFARSNRTPYWNPVVSFTTQAAPSSIGVVNVYPNPSATGFTVEKEYSRIRQITLLASNGIPIFTASGSDTYVFGEQLLKGIYLLKVVTDEGVEMHRLVKE